jgi:ribosomal protein L11 methyltransferase
MMDQFIQISLTNLQPGQSEILIAQLADSGFTGFEEKENSLEAFINQEDYDQSVIQSLADNYSLSFGEQLVKNENWNQVWESNFLPVTVSDFVAVRAGFHQPITDAEYEIVITPKMSFGTGHHATTYMMIELMRDIDFHGKLVTDFGTGTAVLAILAEKLGAEKVTAIDHDDWSIENAIENRERNGCQKISVIKDTAITSAGLQDIILANINKHVILENFSSFSRQLVPGGKLLISGILETDEKDLMKVATDTGFRLVKKQNRDKWIALHFIA